MLTGKSAVGKFVEWLSSLRMSFWVFRAGRPIPKPVPHHAPCLQGRPSLLSTHVGTHLDLKLLDGLLDGV